MVLKKNRATKLIVAVLVFTGLLSRAQEVVVQSVPPFNLENWKVTIPEGNGKPVEVEFPDIHNYAENPEINKFMYDDPDGSVVFYTYPSGSTTANTKYSRTELREQMVSGDNRENWTFAEGGYMKGTLAMSEVTKDKKGKYHRVIIMQIHGRLTTNQKTSIEQKDYNAPPMLKVYWENGKVRLKTKVLKKSEAVGNEILHANAWQDDAGFEFKEKVGFDKFTLEIKASEGLIQVTLNGKETKIYNSDSVKKWGVFENYFKAGNYLQTRDEGAFSKVKIYSLETSH